MTGRHCRRCRGAYLGSSCNRVRLRDARDGDLRGRTDGCGVPLTFVAVSIEGDRRLPQRITHKDDQRGSYRQRVASAEKRVRAMQRKQ